MIKPFSQWLKEDYDKFLTESPVAVIDDWDGSHSVVNSTMIKKFAFTTGLWELIDEVFDENERKLMIYKSTSSNKYIIGVWGHQEDPTEPQEVFIVITQVVALPFVALSKLKYTNAIQMTSLMTSKPFRGMGYAKLFYKWFLSKGHTIVSDMVQFNGARRLYSSLSKDANTQADIVDVNELKVLKTDVHVEQPLEEWDIDLELYSLDYEKVPIRILIYIKD